VTLALSAPFDMTGYSKDIPITTAHTSITIVGNGAVFDPGSGDGRFFLLRGVAVVLVTSHVTLQNGSGIWVVVRFTPNPPTKTPSLS
jgi:hypothetical protein